MLIMLLINYTKFYWIDLFDTLLFITDFYLKKTEINK